MKDTLEAKAKNVAGNIRKIREFRNYTQEYLAAKLEISQNAYSKIELGYSRITLERLFQIARILEVDAAHIISLEHTEIIKLMSPDATVNSGNLIPVQP